MQCRIRSLIGALFCVAIYLRVVSSFSRTASRDGARVGNSECIMRVRGGSPSELWDLMRVYCGLQRNKIPTRIVCKLIKCQLLPKPTI
jgi:hypothetical protein